MSLGLEKHNGMWLAFDMTAGGIMASGSSGPATVKAAVQVWREEIDITRPL